MIGASVGSAVVQSNAAKKAAGAQVQASEAGIAETRRQFDAVQELLKPYVEAGTSAMAGLEPYREAGVNALQQQLALAGVSGADAQRTAIEAIERGPEFEALTTAGEEAILQSAAATGGLRGGGTQAALAQFRPQVLSQLINQQYGRLGGLSATGLGVTEGIVGRGQSAAAGVGSAGISTGANVANLLAQQGAAQAGGALGSAKAFGQSFGNIGTLFGSMAGMDADGAGFTIPEGAKLFSRWGF
jgi:hypothetical protein